MSAKISACVIVRNEAQQVTDLVASLHWVDEIVVVDGGSTDDTVDRFRAAGCRVIERPFDQFARQRNFAMTQARYPWVLSIDADERPTPACAQEVRLRLAHPLCDAYRIPIHSTIFGQRMRYGGTQDDRPIRLFRRDAAAWVGAVHEVLRVSGQVGRLSHGFDHVTLPTLAAFLAKMHRYTMLEADARVEQRQRPKARDLWLAPAIEIFRRLIWKQGIWDGPTGWAFAALSGLSTAMAAIRHRQLWQASLAAGLLDPPLSIARPSAADPLPALHWAMRLSRPAPAMAAVRSAERAAAAPNWESRPTM